MATEGTEVTEVTGNTGKIAGSLLDAYRDEYHKAKAEAQVETGTRKGDVLLRAADLWDCVRRLGRGQARKEARK